MSVCPMAGMSGQCSTVNESLNGSVFSGREHMNLCSMGEHAWSCVERVLMAVCSIGGMNGPIFFWRL
jgi:hypothetical protein